MTTKVDRAIAEVRVQRAWLADHGGTEAGYVAKYGAVGGGGAALYESDVIALEKAESALIALGNDLPW